MTDSGQEPQTTPDQNGSEAQPDYRGRIRVALWLLVSVIFVGYLLMGPVEIRLWQSGRLTFVDRDITHVWTYFGDRLPEMPIPSLTVGLYWISVAVMVLTTLVGLWYFLVAVDEDDRDDAPSGPSVATHHD